MVEFFFTEDNHSVDNEEQSSEYFYDVSTSNMLNNSTFKSIVIHKYQHKLPRVSTNQHESDMSLTRVNTSQHKSKMSQHESDTSQHESAQIKKCPRWVNMSQHKSDTSLTQFNLS